MIKPRFAFLALSLGMLAACSTTPRSPAPVSDRGVTTGVTKKSDDNGYYTVKRGDTLYRIALDFGQSYTELGAWNNLTDPNDLKVGQVLRVMPPENGGSHDGAQVASVAAPSGVETRQLSTPPGTKATPNGNKQPYSETATSAEQPATGEGGVAWMWPADGKLLSNFDDNKKGIDIAGKSGQSILAAGAGKVMYAGSGIRGYGNLVIVKHTSTLLSAYAHNKTITVKEGQTVTKGQKIAEMGDSDTDAVKLHFEIRKQGKPVDPSKFLPPR